MSDDSTFCSNCGNKQIDESNNSDKAQTAQRLKPYNKLKQCTCLECGYSGLMGVVKPKNSLCKRFLIPLIPAFIVAFITYAKNLPTWGSIIAVTVTWIIIDIVLGNEKKVLYCPNCGKEIIEK